MFLDIGGFVGEVLSGALTILLSIIGTVAAWRITDLIGNVLKAHAKKSKSRIDDVLVPLVVRALKIFVIVMAVVFAASALDVPLTPLLASITVASVAFSFAAKDTVANIFGGASIFADKPFQIGDVITVAGSTGTVEEIGVRTTRIRTFDDTIFILPNAQVADSPLENVSARRKRKRVMSIGLTYEHDHTQIARAKELLAEILAETPGLEPDPVVRFDEFGDSALQLTAIFWVSDPGDYFLRVDEVNMKVLERFAAEGFDMAFPSQTVYLKKDAQ